LRTFIMYWNKIRAIVIVLIIAITASTANAQMKDTMAPTDVIIRVDGSIVYGKVLEVNKEYVKYRKNDVTDGPIITLPREQVYIISYSNCSNQVITPVFGKRKLDEPAFDANSSSGEKKDDTTKNLKYNIAHGSLKIGMGFSREYSSFKGVDDFKKASSAPSLYAAYQFRFNRFLKTGASLSFAKFNYQYNRSSEYDGIDISHSIQESIATLGFYGRYNLMDGFIKPYLLLGLNINYSDATLNGDIYFRDEGKHVVTTSGITGFKTDFVARGGVDLMISNSFGIYTDIGTGTSLIQIGAVFSFK
ncbi:MAG: hypothetical protein ACOYLO_17610, partial [Ferruginibacter sp.]